MSLRKVFPQLIDVTGASDGDILQYIDANAKVEFVTSSSVDGGNSDVLQDNLNRLDANVSSNTNTVQDNVASASSNITALDASIGTVQSNIDTYATYANSTFGAVTGYTFTKLIAGGANVVANVATDTLTFTAGNNITINADAASDTITFKASLSNSVNNYFIADGSTNAFTLTQAASSNLDILVSVEGLLQSPNLHYQVSSTTLTLMNTLPIENGTEVMVRWIPNTTENTPGISTPSSPIVLGSSFGYASAGQPSNTYSDGIQKFSFTSDSNATDVGELPIGHGRSAGASSTVSGYVFAGFNPTSFPTGVDAISKFPFSSDSGGTDVGELLTAVRKPGSTNSPTHGYSTGGAANPSSVILSTIQKFPFSSDTGSSDVGEIASNNELESPSGTSSFTHGYLHGGRDPNESPSSITTIQKHPFSSDSGTTLVGDLTLGTYEAGATGSSSSTHGYRIGGYGNTNNGVDQIEKYPFSSDTTSSDVGELSVARYGNTGTQSTLNGYSFGGGLAQTNIDKFTFSSDVSATNVATLIGGGTQMAAAQI